MVYISTEFKTVNLTVQNGYKHNCNIAFKTSDILDNLNEFSY